MMKGIAIICVALFLAAFKQNNLPQISEPTFFKDYFMNTTQIDFYGNSSAYIYLNNDTVSSKFINVGSKVEFLENLENNNYSEEFLYKKQSLLYKKTLDFIFLGIFFSFLLFGRNLLTKKNNLKRLINL